MKKLLFVMVIPVILLATGCNQQKEEIARLKAKNDSLLAVGFVKDSNVMQFVNAFNDIQSNLDSIKKKEMIISKTTQGNTEVKGAPKDQINSDINVIYSLMQKNREMVASLRSKLKKSGAHVAELQKMIDNLTKQNEEKEAQIVQLKDELAKMNIKVQDLNTKVGDLSTNVENLNTQNQQKQQVIEEKTAELNTAYYVIGTTRELKDKKIITKAGGFIGLGRSKGLTPDLNKNYFTRVDITKLKAIPIMKNKVSIVTSHPKTSYHLTGKNSADSLIITNPNEFWSLSKVLVINAK
jgi:vacuolar-type H+-ATPase subunit I/STV1